MSDSQFPRKDDKRTLEDRLFDAFLRHKARGVKQVQITHDVIERAPEFQDLIIYDLDADERCGFTVETPEYWRICVSPPHKGAPHFGFGQANRLEGLEGPSMEGPSL